MREIAFRGKRIDNGEWVEGFYLYTSENTHPVIIDMKCCSHIIIPETVGQYTGLKDKNDVKIFEGDIINVTPYITNRLMEVRWNDEMLSWKLTDVGIPTFEINPHFNTIDLAELRVEPCYGERVSFIVGNIWDNPKLISGLSEEE